MTLDMAWRCALRDAGLGFGGAPLGNLFTALADDAAIALVRHAYAAGARYFDTAPHYGNGLSEQRIGVALRGLPRDSLLLSTKVGRVLSAAPDAPRAQHGYVDVLPYVQHYDYSRDGVLRSLCDSLRRLDQARVDFVYVHDLDVATHGDRFAEHLRALLDGGLPALAELKAEGTIRGYGLGVNSIDVCLQTLRHADLDLILLAGRYTLLDQSALVDLLPECSRREVGIVLGGPFNSGILASGAHPADGAPAYFNYAPAPPHIVARVAAIEATCAEFGVPLAAAALQFPRAHPAVLTVIPGARTVAEFNANRRFAGWAIPASLWQALRDRRLIADGAPVPQC
jgi:D-threo-aldose 1-dehydrogenase